MKDPLMIKVNRIEIRRMVNIKMQMLSIFIIDITTASTLVLFDSFIMEITYHTINCEGMPKMPVIYFGVNEGQVMMRSTTERD